MKEGRTVMGVRGELIIVDSYRNFRLRVKYIGVAMMLELKGIHSFLSLTDRTGAYFLYIITAVRQWQCFYRLAQRCPVGWLKDVHIGWLMIHTFTDGSWKNWHK